MSLAGLLNVITDDPQFRQVVAQAAADSDGGLPGRRRRRDRAVRAPSALLAAALTGLPRDRQPVPARGHRDRQGSRRASRSARLAAARRRRGLLPRLGDTPATKRLSPRSDTSGQRPGGVAPACPPRSSQFPYCCGHRPRHSGCAPLLQPIVGGPGRRGAGLGGRRRQPATWTRCWPGSSTSATSGPIWWSGAVR